MYSFFAHNLKKFSKFTKFVEPLETKGLKLLRNVKTQWVSMLNPLKCVLAHPWFLVVKMHFNCEKNKSTLDNFELLCELDLILGLPCVMLILEVVHSLINCAQCRDVFIMEFLNAINLAKAELFCLYIDRISNFSEPLFNDFTKLL